MTPPTSHVDDVTAHREARPPARLPLIHLDRHYWRPGWVAPDGAEFRAEVSALAARPAG
ncbi:hypothetical protein [Micromonospora psammae]|uniref:hypothetical protein n=1 Tax=Micromonospora sp. CPCC 205556 TaxID=3122398 RepID=UPI002FF03192